MEDKRTQAQRLAFVNYWRPRVKTVAKHALRVPLERLSVDEQYLFIRDILKINTIFISCVALAVLFPPSPAVLMVILGGVFSNLYYASFWLKYLDGSGRGGR
jgi:hypothetical protein